MLCYVYYFLRYLYPSIWSIFFSNFSWLLPSFPKTFRVPWTFETIIIIMLPSISILPLPLCCSLGRRMTHGIPYFLYIQFVYLILQQINKIILYTGVIKFYLWETSLLEATIHLLWLFHSTLLLLCNNKIKEWQGTVFKCKI